MPTRAKLLIRQAANYEEMFNATFKALDATPEFAPGGPKEQQAIDGKNWVKKEITWAKKTFQSNNAWITWWLRWVRLCFEKMYLPELFQKDFRAAQAKNPRITANDVQNGALAYEQFHRYIEHFISTPAPGIAAYRPEWQTLSQVHNELRDIEKDWQKSRAAILQPQEGDTILIKFPDGWAWWLLNRHRCDEESRAMGHCGNGGSNDTTQRILSLRQPKGGNNWEPHLTFILEGNGFLGEMKGKNNDKPVNRYHKYIIALLENDIVKGIQGGGYLPEHNFAITDLTPEEQEALYEKKPALMPISVYYKKFGPDETFVEKVKAYFQETDNEEIGWLPEAQKFQIEEYADLDDLIQGAGNDTAKWAYKVLSGDEHLDVDSGYSQKDAAKNMLEELPNEEIEKIGRTLVRDYAGQVNDWLEENGYDPEEDEFDVTDEDDIISFAEYVGDEVFEALDRAWETGHQWGAEKEISKYLEQAIEDSVYVQSGDGIWNSKFYEAIDIPTVLELIDNNNSLYDYKHEDNDAREVRMGEPYNGFNDFDEKGAIESFHDEYDVEKQFREALGDEGVAQYEAEMAEKKRYMDERTRVADEIRSKFKDASPAVRKELQDADWAFRQGDYTPFVKMVRAVIPDAFPFAPEEEPVTA